MPKGGIFMTPAVFFIVMSTLRLRATEVVFRLFLILRVKRINSFTYQLTGPWLPRGFSEAPPPPASGSGLHLDNGAGFLWAHSETYVAFNFLDALVSLEEVVRQWQEDVIKKS